MVVSVSILPGRNISKVVTVKVSEEMLSFMKKRCDEEGVTVSKLVREAILLYLREEPGEIIDDIEKVNHEKTLSFKMTKLFLTRLDEYAMNHRMSRSQVVRSSIFYYFMTKDGDK
jgi:predicted DNA-binding protein